MPPLHHGERLLFRLKQQQQSGRFCDCTVAVGGSRFRAHRNVLAAFSEYFSSQYQAAGVGDPTTSLDPEYVSEEVFQKLLDYVYTGDLTIDSNNVDDITKAATFLKMEDIVSQCVLLQEDVKPFCVRVEETNDCQQGAECEPDTPGRDACHPAEPEEASDPPEPEEVSVHHRPETEGETEGERGCPEPPTREEEAVASAPKPRTSKRGRKPKVMFDASPPQALCTVSLRRLTRQQIPRTARTFADANNAPPGQAEGREEGAAPATGGEEEEEEEMEGGDPAEHKPPSRKAPLKRRAARKGSRLKENCKRAPAATAARRGRRGHLDGELKLKLKPECDTCGRTFSESSSLRRHMRIHKGVKPYECHLCGRAFRQGNQLKTHLRIHTGEKPYQCNLCDKGFAQKCQLVFHCRMHHGEEKPYKCEVCGLQFATSSNFKIHNRKHSGEKPYECDRCGKHFAQASTLTYHMRRHTGEKPYVCDTCGKAFAVSSSLITHSRKHAGDSPHMCLICGKGFLSLEDLNKHLLCHTGGKRFECEFCGNSYTDAKYLRKHKVKVHKEELRQDPVHVSFPMNIPIDHQTLISRLPPGPGTAELLTRAAAAAAAASQSEVQIALLQPIN
ncbi:myoneurin-like [Megalops cyprinoides]|uniref:myoneurin-like n=1 Tax=Megalops cyprinoides TaxID=118141 RepID=UPI0018648C34|nr:myoneurin-like [Megalops cyprinoides]